MGKIILSLVRQCAEHNDGELSTLEEISLHQRDIERIEHLHRCCPRLRILLLQGNLISKIENVHRLRELEYLNLALNNIEKIEGLEGCEALAKLDLTANFITHLTSSAAALQDLPNLRELYLTGNPCTSYRGYRSWMVCILTGLEELDGASITRSERLKALQEFTLADSTVREDQQDAVEKRARERERYEEGEIVKESEASDMTDEEWWNSNSEHTPESRLAMHRELQQRRKNEQGKEESNANNKKNRPLKLFASDGRPLNVNSGKLDFTFKEEEEDNCFVLEVHTYRHLDPSLVSCDVEPWYVRVTVKKKVLQLVLLEEVRPGQTTAKRSNITGHLVVTMPKLLPPRTLSSSSQVISLQKPKTTNTVSSSESDQTETRANYLEIGDGVCSVDYTRIVQDPTNVEEKNHCNGALGDRLKRSREIVPERPNSPNFIDDDSVPPLE